MSEVKDITKSINGLFSNFSNRRKFQFIFILFLNLLSGYSEFLIVGSVGLFITSITQPEILYKSNLFDKFINIIGMNQINDARLIILILFISIILFSSIIRLLNLWINMKFRVAYFKDLSKKAFAKVLYQDYEYHIQNNSSELISDLTINMEMTNGFIDQFLVIFMYVFSAISIISAILFINFKLTLLIISIIGFTYILLTTFINRKISKYGKYVVESNNILFRTLQEGLGSIKDVILENNQIFHTDKFESYVGRARKYEAIVSLLSQSPKFFIEGLGLIIIALIGFSISSTSESNNAITFLGSFALGAQKLLPAIQNIYSSWTNLISYNKGFEKILILLCLPALNKGKNIGTKNPNKVKFNNRIIFKNIYYKYPNTENFSLKNINLEIKKGEKIGIIGKTGSGKSTFINLLMGLLEPYSGNLIIDKKDLFNSKERSNLFDWRNSIGHVPQKIFLADTTILENIAFAEDRLNIKLKEVEEAADKACIKDYIISTKNKFYTIVGEQGINMSGGQLQRIGIARALYKRKEVLIFDEATSALDNETETKLIRKVNSLTKGITIFIVAHRLSTLKNCDRILEFKNGKISRIFPSNELKTNIG